MSKRLARFARGLFVSLALLVPTAALASAPILLIQDLGKGTARIDGLWQFHPGDDPDGFKSWRSPSLDDSDWQSITVDQPWGAQTGHRNLTGYAWYRRHIVLSASAGVSPNFTILIEHVDDAYELYWNGILIGSNGKLPPHPTWYNDQAAQTFTLPYVVDPIFQSVGAQTGNVLAVRVWKAPLVSYDSGQQGGFSNAPEIGSQGAIAAHKAALDYDWLRVRQIIFAIDCLYTLLALLSFLAWLRDRTRSVLLWMAGFFAAPVIILVLDGLRLLWPFDVALSLQQPIYSLEDISLWFMLLWTLRLRENAKLLRATQILAIVNVACTTLDGVAVLVGWSGSWNPAVQLTDAILSAVDLTTEVWPLLIVVFAITRPRRLNLANWLVAVASFLSVMMSVLKVALAQGSRFTHWTIAERISSPIFTLNGNPVTLYLFFRICLVIALIYAVYRYYDDVGRRRTTLEQELQSVRELQQVLIPDTPPTVPGFTLTGAYHPAQEVGGDFFQIIPIESAATQGGSTLIILGDVSGKGLKAAMAVAVILGAVRALAPFFTDPALLLGELNQSLQGRLQGAFATCIVLRVDHDGRCLLASAGHPPPFLNDGELTLPGALPLALVSSASYEDVTIKLKVDDRLSLYTDGLLEARNPAGELYSFERLKELFATKPTAEQATEAAVAFGQDDDITVLTLTRQSANYREPRSLSETQTIRIYPVTQTTLTPVKSQTEEL